MDIKKTLEPQYQRFLTLRDTKGLSRLGLSTNYAYDTDPRHILFLLARYKFVAKMLSGKKKILEIGCGDAFGTRLVLQEVDSILAIDFDPIFVKDVNERMEEKWKFECYMHDITTGPVNGSFDAAYSLDVIEHIPKEKEHLFISNIARSLDENGLLIIGTPSVQSQVYASDISKEGHANCKDAEELKELMLNIFHNVFIFSMNDEVVHMGFYPMAQYLLALCCSKKLAVDGLNHQE